MLDTQLQKAFFRLAGKSWQSRCRSSDTRQTPLVKGLCRPWISDSAVSSRYLRSMPNALTIDNSSASEMKIQVPQGMGMSCFVAANFALFETISRQTLARRFRSPLFHPPPCPHPPTHGGIRRHLAKFWLLASQCHQVVGVQLVAPMRNVAILLAKRRQQPITHRLGLACISANLTLERSHRIGGPQGPAIPTLDGRAADNGES